MSVVARSSTLRVGAPLAVTALLASSPALAQSAYPQQSAGTPAQSAYPQQSAGTPAQSAYPQQSPSTPAQSAYPQQGYPTARYPTRGTQAPYGASVQSTSQPTSALPAWPPAVLPYRDGQPIPKAYRLENHANTGLVVGGTVTFLASYTAALVFAASHDFDNGLSWTLAPVVGPYGAIGARSFSCHQTDPTSNKCLNRAVDEVKAVTFLAVDGLVQAVGVTLLIVGVADRKKELVRIDMAGAKVEPRIWMSGSVGGTVGHSPGAYHFGFTGTF